MVMFVVSASGKDQEDDIEIVPPTDDEDQDEDYDPSDDSSEDDEEGYSSVS